MTAQRLSVKDDPGVEFYLSCARHRQTVAAASVSFGEAEALGRAECLAAFIISHKNCLLFTVTEHDVELFEQWKSEMVLFLSGPPEEIPKTQYDTARAIEAMKKLSRSGQEGVIEELRNGGPLPWRDE